MKIDRIDLLAVGPFTGKRLDLSAGNSGLHLIYGDNENGKSSTMRAIEDFFFGFPERPTNDFLHEMSTLQVGMLLRDKAGKSYDWIRSKKRKESLRDIAGEVVPDTAMHDLIGGIRDDEFKSFFSMNHQQLLEGGEAVLEGEGAVGDALYSASRGGAHLKTVLDSLGSQSAGLFKRSASLPPINAGIKLFDQANKERDEASTRTSVWKQLRQQVEEAETKQKAAHAALSAANEKKADRKRLLDAVPLLLQRSQLRASIEAMGTVPNLPADFSARRGAADTTLAGVIKARLTNLERLTAAEAELLTLDVPTELLAVAERIEQLHRRADGYLQTRDSLPRLRAMCDGLASQSAELLKRLSPTVPMDQVESLRLSEVDRQTILKLAHEFERLDERAGAARRQRDQLAENLSATPVQTAGETVPDARELRLRLDEIESRDVSERTLLAVQKERAASDRQWRAAGTRLGLSDLPEESWHRLPVPNDETVAASVREFERVAAEIERVKTESIGLNKKAFDTRRKLDALGRGKPVPTVAALLDLREDRDARWQLIRSDPASIPDAAAAYESAVASADELVDEIRNDTARVVQHEQLEQQQRDIAEEIVRLEPESKKADQWRDEADARWQLAWAPTGLVPKSPAEMRAWLVEYRALRDAIEKAAVFRSSELVTEKGLSDAAQALRDARTAAGAPPAPADSYAYELAATKELLEQIRQSTAEMAKRSDARRSAEKALKKAEVDLADSSEAKRVWDGKWEAATTRLGSMDAGIAQQLVTLNGQLFETLESLKQQTMKRADAEKMLGEFEAEANELARLFSVDRPTANAIETELTKQLAAGRKTEVRRADMIARRTQLQADIEQNGRDENAARQELADLCSIAGVAEPAELPAVENRFTERTKCLSELRPVEVSLLGLSNGRGIDELAAEVAGTSMAQLETEITETAAAAVELSQRFAEASEVLGAQKTEFNRIDGSGKAADAANRAQMLAAGVVEKASQYVRLKVAETLLRKAVEEYRRHHQGPLVKRAGEIFSRLTEGSFARLAVSYEETEDGRLCGVRPNEMVVPVSGMSDGTRDALYLSLRLASLEETLVGREPFPLLVDDVTINLDDKRSRAILSVLAELSDKTQVIFFTHHSRMIDLATDAASGRLTVHHLADPVAAA